MTIELEEQIRRLDKQREALMLAASDMEQAAAAALALDREETNLPLMRALETAIATCYTRPFTKGTYVPRLDPKRWAPAVPMDGLHDALLSLRNRTYAHTDETSGRHAGPPLDVLLVPGASEVTHLAGWWAFPRAWLPHVIALCDHQAQRFVAEAHALLERAAALLEDRS